ncbi:MerR family transcriptional regulator [Kitasatospora purpeofusca]|uniref:MerR family transcriptional regulator n=1 Tax=Kitasatospora purpeofusca TaxID=67352 RepID=UPI00386BCC8B|nr:MerR family transcriptional regulator [Kitasatospora purpeofusca]
MRIGELARATGTTARALRHYEQAGLIDSGRAANGYRVYGESAVTRVRNIRSLLEAGFTLEDVRPFLGCLDQEAFGPPSAGALRIARDRLAVLERRIAAQAETRDRLAAAIAGAEAAAAPTEAAAAATGAAPAPSG